MARKRSAAVLAGFGLVAIVGGGDAGATDLIGVESATLEWTPATGPVAGYYVIVEKNGAAPVVIGMSDDTVETIDAAFGDEIVVQVAAFDASGVAGPMSAQSNPIRFLRETNPGSGEPPTPEPEPEPIPGDTGGDPTGSPVAIDFDGDGRSDVVLRDLGTGALTLWEMHGERIRGAIALPPLPLHWSLIGVADTDGDDFPDLLWHEPASGRVMVWRMVSGASVGGGMVDLSGLPEGGEWQVGGCGDVDADGREDLIFFSRALGQVEVLHLDGASVLAQSTFTGNSDTQSVVSTADHDGDGDAEIVWRDGVSEALELWDLTESGVAVTAMGTYTGARVLGAGDYDGDGAADLVLQLAGGEVEAHTAAAGVLPLGSTPGSEYAATTRGDYDGNGRSDLLWANAPAEQVEIWFTNADGVVPGAASGDVIQPDEDVVSGNNGNDAAFRERLCDGDFDDDGNVGGSDFGLLSRCMGQPAEGACEPADMDSNGIVGGSDYGLFRRVFGGPACPDGF